MIDTTGNEEQNNSVRKTLQSLPKVEASGDFEQRLRTRLSEGQQHGPAKHSTLIGSWRIPAYAISVLAVAAIGIVTYYSVINVDTPVLGPQPDSQNAEEQKIQEAPSAASRPEVTRTQRQEAEAGTPAAAHGPTQSAAPSVSFPRESMQDDPSRRGLLREVGGVGEAPAQRTIDFPFVEIVPGTTIGRQWIDSVSRVDSLRQDSLRRMIERQQGVPR
jgi:hypothetical protein